MKHAFTLWSLALVFWLPACSKADSNGNTVVDTTSAGAPGTDAGAPGPSPSANNPFVLACSVNLDGRDTVVRGWPAVLRVGAAFDRAPDAGESYALDDDALALGVRNARGDAQSWELEVPATSGAVLDGDHTSVEALRVLPADATSELEPGTYRLEVTWGPARDELEIAVEDAPQDSPDVREARALLQADALTALGKIDEALDVLDAALDEAQGSVALFNQRALVREAGGDDEGAFLDAQAALRLFSEQYPDSTEPPITILDITQRLALRVVGGEP